MFDSLKDLDWGGLGTAIAVLAKSNPTYAVATGLVSLILGKAIFGKSRKKKEEIREKEELLEHLKRQKGVYGDEDA